MEKLSWAIGDGYGQGKKKKLGTRGISPLNGNRFNVHNESFISLHGFKILPLTSRAVTLLFSISVVRVWVYTYNLN